MNKSLDETKKGLECCIEGGCSTCPFNIPNQYTGRCIKNLTTAADSLIQQLEATVSEKEKVVDELSWKIGRLEADNKLLQDAVDQWELVAASPGAVEDMARENTELLKKVEQLQAERDAAVDCIPRECGYCKHDGTADFDVDSVCDYCLNGNTRWQWRGVQKEG